MEPVEVELELEAGEGDLVVVLVVGEVDVDVDVVGDEVVGDVMVVVGELHAASEASLWTPVEVLAVQLEVVSELLELLIVPVLYEPLLATTTAVVLESPVWLVVVPPVTSFR